MGYFVRGGKNGMGCYVRDDKTAWDVMSGVTKTACDVLSGVANLCGMFCPGCQKMAWDVLSRDVLSGSPDNTTANSGSVQCGSAGAFITPHPITQPKQKTVFISSCIETFNLYHLLFSFSYTQYLDSKT